jgi:hypothetical protein
MTFYGISEYQDSPAVMTGGNWGTAVARISAPAPTFSNVVPAAVEEGLGSVIVTVTGTGFYSPPLAGASACRTDLDATTTFPGLVVNSVNFTNAGAIDLDLDTTGASEGMAEITIVNPDGQEVMFQLGIGDRFFLHGFEQNM